MAEQKQQTLTFSLQETKELEMKKALQEVYAALTEKGYNPINQIVGYILSGDRRMLRITKMQEASSGGLISTSCSTCWCAIT